MTKEFYINNRKKYFNKIEDGSMTILSSNVILNKTADEDFDFEVDKNFYYLTGINQEDVVLVLTKINNECKEYLFIKENDPVLVKWIGAKLYIDEAKTISGIENVYYDNNYLEDIKKLSANISKLYLNLESKKGYAFEHNKYFNALIKENLVDIPTLDCYKIIVSLRAVKEQEEVEKIKDAINITKGGIESLMKNCKAGMYEYQLESYFDFHIKNNGNRLHSFKTICAGGINATILHYSKNNSILNDNDLVLFDLGNESDIYISDISRTFPVNGKFTPRQKQIYEEVLNVNKKCIEFLKPGITNIEYNKYALKLLTESCYRLNLIKSDEEVRKYYFHSIGHSIGLDTHDPCFYENGITEGMVLTVEPGLYIPEEKIGIRIEDNVLITKDGAVNLSKDIIKEVEDIENFFEKYNK